MSSSDDSSDNEVASSDGEKEIQKTPEEEENERTQIRDELSAMSFEDLLKLKDKLGTKLYNEAMLGPSKTSKRKRTEFKRENKNRPREMSSKKQVSLIKEVVHVKKHIARDPRFDSLCGNYSEKAFKTNYKFLNDVRGSEIESLKKELKNCDDPKRVTKLKYLIQRMENQNREEKSRKEKEEKLKEERNAQRQALKDGQKPVYYKKSEKRILDLVGKYEDLKKSGGLQKHIEKQRKRNTQKDRKKFKMDTTV